MNTPRKTTDGISTTIYSREELPKPIITASVTIYDDAFTDQQYDALQKIFRDFISQISQIPKLP